MEPWPFSFSLEFSRPGAANSKAYMDQASDISQQSNCRCGIRWGGSLLWFREATATNWEPASYSCARMQVGAAPSPIFLENRNQKIQKDLTSKIICEQSMCVWPAFVPSSLQLKESRHPRQGQVPTVVVSYHLHSTWDDYDPRRALKGWLFSKSRT